MKLYESSFMVKKSLKSGLKITNERFDRDI